MALFPTPASPSTTNLVLSGSAMANDPHAGLGLLHGQTDFTHRAVNKTFVKNAALTRRQCSRVCFWDLLFAVRHDVVFFSIKTTVVRIRLNENVLFRRYKRLREILQSRLNTKTNVQLFVTVDPISMLFIRVIRNV